MAKLVTLKEISLKNHPEIKESTIQDLIKENPSILNLGDISLITSEKKQPNGGRLDLLLTDDADTRYELELQLGSTDESHIIRTIEYWDIERKRYPQYDHCAVIAAEDITSRFFNVISLFNGHIPIIALKLTAYKQTDGNILITFTKVLDRITLGTDEEEVLEPTDRAYWIKRATPHIMEMTDQLFSRMIGDDSTFTMKYNKYYVGIARDNTPVNFIYFKPKKKWIWLIIKAPKNEILDESIDSSGMECEYDARNRRYRIKISTIEDYDNNREIIDKMVESAREYFGI